MEWTRSPLMRTVALVASLALVVVHRDDRGVWFWVGVALVVLNVTGFLRSRSPVDPPSEPPTDPPTDPPHEEDRSRRLEELLFLPGVAAAFAGGPPLWRQVSYLDDEQFEPTTAEELAAYVWLEDHDGWGIGLGDEVKPYLDLDLDEADDPIIGVFRAHPAVAGAYHEDREVYRVEQRGPLSTEEFAELAARALVAHHVHVLRT